MNCKLANVLMASFALLHLATLWTIAAGFEVIPVERTVVVLDEGKLRWSPGRNRSKADLSILGIGKLTANMVFIERALIERYPPNYKDLVVRDAQGERHPVIFMQKDLSGLLSLASPTGFNDDSHENELNQRSLSLLIINDPTSVAKFFRLIFTCVQLANQQPNIGELNHDYDQDGKITAIDYMMGTFVQMIRKQAPIVESAMDHLQQMMDGQIRTKRLLTLHRQLVKPKRK